MLADPLLFANPGPKSTGRGYFDEGWIDAHVRACGSRAAPADVQRTLCELCAATVQQAIETAAHPGAKVFVCGGGVHNRTLFDSLRARLAPRAVAPTDALGIPADYVEALTFAWLAMRALEGRPGKPPVGDRSPKCGRTGRDLSGRHALTAAVRRLRLHARGVVLQMENESPHPQVEVALGFLTTNCEPCRSSW